MAIWRAESLPVRPVEKTKSTELVDLAPEVNQQQSVAQKPTPDPAKKETEQSETKQPEKGRQELAKKARADRTTVVYFLKFVEATAAADKLRLFIGDEPKAKVGVDQRLNSIVVTATKTNHKAVKLFIEKLDRKLGAQERRSKESLLTAIELLNRCWERGVPPNETEAKKIQSQLPAPYDQFVNLSGWFKNLEMPSSIRAIENEIDRESSWVHGPYDYPFTYTVNFRQFMVDAEQIVDSFLGDEIFQPALDGILEDEEGPKLDIRHLVKTFKDRVMLVVRSGEPQDRLMFVIPLTDTKDVSTAIEKVAAVMTDLEKTIYKGVDLYENMRDRRLDEDLARLDFVPVGENDDDATTGVCVVGGCFVIGNAIMVREAIDRQGSIAR